MISLRKCFHGNIRSRRATEDIGWRSDGSLSWPIMDHYHRAPHTIYTKLTWKQVWQYKEQLNQIQKQVENEIKSIIIIIIIFITIINYYHLCNHLYTHIIIISMKSYVKMERFSLSLFFPFIPVSLLLPWKTGRARLRRCKGKESHVSFACYMFIWCATISAFLCKWANHLYTDRGM